ncbi:MAG: S8 family serine peptidase, partial [Thermoanaerobaculia bacterium]
ALVLSVIVLALPLHALDWSLDRNTEAKVIIEFADQRASVAQLERDLAALEPRAKHAANAERAVKFQYKQAFSGASATVNRASLAAIRALPYVKRVHMDREFKTHLVESVPRIGAPQVWEQFSVRGRGIVVAIIDTGIDYTHPSLGNGFGPGHKVMGGWDFVNDDDDPRDDNGHGTHVAGIVAGNEAPVIGVAPEASLLAYKVLNAGGGGQLSAIIAAVERAMDPNGDGDTSDHAHVVNMSLGGPLSYEDPLVHAVEQATANGVVFALSAGNARTNGSIGSPGSAPSAITVAATDREDLPAFFSSRGPIGGTWRLKPDVAAPGTEIVSARNGGGTKPASGTSMAAPHIAGVAALLLQQHPDWTPAEIKAAIVSTAEPVYLPDAASARILAAGAGRVDAVRAIQATILPSPSGLSFGIVPQRGQAFTAKQTLRLTNRGGATETLTIDTHDPRVTANPAEVTINAGASVQVEFTLSLPAAALEPTEDLIALTGMIELTGSQSTLRVPWLTVNGDVLSVTYSGDEEFYLSIFPRGFQVEVWPLGPRTYGAFASHSADIVVLGEDRLVIREQQPIDGQTAVTIAPDEAIHTIELKPVDERGVPLPSSHIAHEFLFPSTANLTLSTTAGTRSLKISPLQKTTIRTYESAFLKDAQYLAMYRVLDGIRQDETLSVAATDWAMQTLRHSCETPCDAMIGTNLGSAHSFSWHMLEPGSATWKLFMTPVAAENVDFHARVGVREQTLPLNRPSAPWTFLSPPLRGGSGGISVAPMDRASAADYAPPNAQKPLVFGEGPLVL